MWLGCLVCGSLLFAGSPEPDENVNTRYKVETVVVAGNGWSENFVSGQDRVGQGGKISVSLTRRITSLLGDQLNPATLDDVAKRLGRELQANVSHRVLPGAAPSEVKVVFQVRPPNERFDATVSKFIFDSREGWTGAVEGAINVKQNRFAFGVVSDNDDLMERYAGINARYEDNHLGTDRVHFQFEFDGYHDQWNSATLTQLPPASPQAPGLQETSAPYRGRQNFEPTVTLVLAAPVTLSFGVSFERLQDQLPGPHEEAADAVVSTIRYRQMLEDSDTEQDLEASYSLRAATRMLASDFVYARHRWDLRYRLNRGKSTLTDDVSAGFIEGRAPLYDRYILGNTSTLRGWDKSDLDPIGGNRIVHNSVDYRYRVFEAFYDAGAIWDAGEPVVLRHAAGVGIREGAFAMAVAFPIRGGRADPIFMMGMNY
ncbi:MAG TPA: BamA/TamA family outer membrane protein [Bryobacteraceae bacterium]|nr:BamA/TamA family outer membrane protein [Bryobacteraceae bacterium]